MPQKTITEDDLLKITGEKTLNKIKNLDLSGQGLEDIDVPLFNKLTSLTELDLRDNQLQGLPRDLALPKLEDLDLSENRLSCLEFVAQFPQLQSLYVNKNTHLKPSDLYIAAFLCPTLDHGHLGKDIYYLQSSVSTMVDKLSYKVKGVWDALYMDSVNVHDITDQEKDQLLIDFSSALQKQNLRDDNTLLKFQNYILNSMAAEIIKQLGLTNDTPQMSKRVSKRKLNTIYEDDVIDTSTPKASKTKHKTDMKQEQIKSAKKEKKVTFTKITPRENPLPDQTFTLPSLPDYSPVHFVRCHSYDNNPDDRETKVWRCAFEPDPHSPEKNTDIVATCGRLIVCLLDCKSGKVMKRYQDDNEDESFYCIAWTTVTMETKDTSFPTNLLAVAGEGEVIKLIHPQQLVVYAALKGHKKAIQSLTFHPDKPTQLFCGSDDGRITVWDIGIPDPITYSTKYSQLWSLQCPGTGVLSIVYSSTLDWLVVGCEHGCFGWNLTLGKKTSRLPTLEFALPESDGEECVDGLALLPGDVIATKCVGQSVLYLWSLENHITDTLVKSTKVMEVDALCGLQYPHHTTPYISMFCLQGVVVVGDGSDSVLMFDLRKMAKAGKFLEGKAKPSRELLWPHVSIGKNSSITKISHDKVIINMAGISSDGRYLVACMDNNLIGVWWRD